MTGTRWVGAEDVTANLLTGRAGTGGHRRIRHVLPMSFRDFVVASGRGLPTPQPCPVWELQSPDARDVLQPLSFLLDDYDLAWQTFLRSGGFPRAVYEGVNHGRCLTGLPAGLGGVADCRP